MKKLMYFACLWCVLVYLSSCKKKEEEPILCSLYGTVTDKATGDPIRSAGVELLPLGSKAVTGNDGVFEFKNIEEGVYKLLITKTGYKEHTSNDIAVKLSSKSQSHNIQIEKLPPALTILGDNKQEIDSIDFGRDDGIAMRSFNIFNNSDDKLEWSIVYQCDWIKSISKIEGELKANATQGIVITIDRLKLNLGDNSTLINIVSNNGSKQLTITASCNNVIETQKASNVSGVSAVLNANVVRDLNPSITEYGFVYSISPAPRLTNGAKKESQAGTPKVGLYSMLINGLENNTQYFSCAYVSNAVDTIYGEQIDFTTTSHIPAVTIESTQEKSTSITVTLKVTSDGGLALEDVGLCWSTDPVPTVDDNYKKVGNEVKQYTTKISELTPNNTYYIRAYVRNAESENYSSQVVTTTKDGLPTVITTVVGENVTENSAVSGGQVTDDGGYTVTARGVCWNTLPSPTINDNKTTDGSGTGYYSSNIIGIDLNSTNIYYVRAYATNQNGTTYGEQVTVSKENWDYKNLPAIEYGGYIYRLYPDIGSMKWSEANTACQNLVYGGYDDWMLPETKDLLVHIMRNYKTGWKYSNGTTYIVAEEGGVGGTSAYYWTNATSGNATTPILYCYCVYYYEDQHYGTSIRSENVSPTQSKRVRPVRKYLANQ